MKLTGLDLKIAVWFASGRIRRFAGYDCLRHQIVEVEGVEEGLLRLIVVTHHGSGLHP